MQNHHEPMLPTRWVVGRQARSVEYQGYSAPYRFQWVNFSLRSPTQIFWHLFFSAKFVSYEIPVGGPPVVDTIFVVYSRFASKTKLSMTHIGDFDPPVDDVFALSITRGRMSPPPCR